jgi:thioredoxin
MALPEVTTATFAQEVLALDKAVLVDFWVPGCQPCLALTPAVEALAQAHANDLKVVRVNATARENWPLCLRQGVMGLPLFLFFRGGKQVRRMTGQVTPQLLAESLDALMSAGRRPSSQEGT